MGDAPPNNFFDIDLTIKDIQSLNNAQALLAFFTRLGYQTGANTLQTPANLGITADSIIRPIKKIELIADQEGLFQVYLFELTAVTVALTRSLTSSFRNRAGNYFLILTSDYERLDFVLIEKYLPVSAGPISGFGQKQIGVRPRVLTLERKKPNTVDMRVLRRLSWTEADPFAQYEKILSAFAIADWSEEHFNNRALFSDYYLLKRLPEFPDWQEDPKPTYLQLRRLYQETGSNLAGKEKETLWKNLRVNTFFS